MVVKPNFKLLTDDCYIFTVHNFKALRNNVNKIIIQAIVYPYRKQNCLVQLTLFPWELA